MIEAVRKTSQIVQVGMQRRSAPSVIKAKELIDSGILGRITLVKPMWNWNVSKPLDNSPLPGKLDWKRFLGTAPDRDLEPMRFRSWRYFWDYSGGNMTDQGTHLMDVVQWFTNSGLARSAVCFGQKAKNTGSEVPDVFCAVFEYENLMATWTLNYCNSYDNDWSIQFQGDEGTMILNNAGYRIWKEPVPKNPEPVQTDGRAHSDRDAHSEFPGLREVAQGAQRAGGSGRQRGLGAAPGERGVPRGTAGAPGGRRLQRGLGTCHAQHRPRDYVTTYSDASRAPSVPFGISLNKIRRYYTNIARMTGK